MVKDPSKYKTLISIADISAKAAEANGSSVMVMASAGEIIGGEAALFKPRLFYTFGAAHGQKGVGTRGWAACYKKKETRVRGGV